MAALHADSRPKADRYSSHSFPAKYESKHVCIICKQTVSSEHAKCIETQRAIKMNGTIWVTIFT